MLKINSTYLHGLVEIIQGLVVYPVESSQTKGHFHKVN